MFRVHQFDKVEMFVFTHPERSGEAHDSLLATEEELVAELGLPYRVVNIAAGDLGASASKKYDIEAWFPGQGRYREITSTSNTTDYQSRRLEIRFRAEKGLEFVHTLNGTAVTARDDRRPRELPGGGRRGRGARGLDGLRRSRPHRAGGLAPTRATLRGGRGARAVERAVLKTAERLKSVPWVRIPPPPLTKRVLWESVIHPGAAISAVRACCHRFTEHLPVTRAQDRGRS